MSCLRPPQAAAYARFVRQQRSEGPYQRMRLSFLRRLPHLLVAFASFGGCAPTSLPPLSDPRRSPDLVAALADCWQFTPSSSNEAYLPQGLVVRFDTVQTDTLNPHRLHLAVDTPLARRVRIAGWGLLERPNRLIAFWGDGFTGLDLNLELRSDSLRGRATHTVDFPAPRSSFRVAASRVPCPSGL
jgi:hypothetical protein